MKKYIAESFGTFTLTAIVILSLSSESIIATPIAAGLTLLLFVYSIGSISGTHINPAVTLGLMSIGKISKKESLMYIVYQLIGASLAMILLNTTGHIPTDVTAVFSTETLIAEICGACIFTFGIASVVYGKVHEAFSGVVVGGSLLLGILFAAYLGSNGVLNPAVALGIGSMGWAYVLGPILGSLLGFRLYRFLSR
jgi:glycerol uptake facilitator-like aquaporin